MSIVRIVLLTCALCAVAVYVIAAINIHFQGELQEPPIDEEWEAFLDTLEVEEAPLLPAPVIVDEPADAVEALAPAPGAVK